MKLVKGNHRLIRIGCGFVLDISHITRNVSVFYRVDGGQYDQ